MVTFWIAAAGLVAIAIVFTVVPLLRSRPGAGPSRDEASLAVLRGQRREIEQDVASGTLLPESRDEALAELVLRAGEELASGASASTAQGRPWILAAALGFAVPVVALGLYLHLGTPEATDPKLLQAAPKLDDPQIVAMVERLAKKVREEPNNAQGWALLARSMNALGRHREAIEAYENLVRLVPGDASILADYADALAMTQGRSLAGKPSELIQQALKVDPRNPKALALAGTIALNEGNFAAALRHWETLATVVPPGSEDAAKVQSIIAEVRERAAASGKSLGPAAPKPATTLAAAGQSVSGKASLSPALAAKVAGNETLFIFARADGGPRVPLAVLRASVRELPKSWELTDAMAMAPGMTISSAPALRIEVRVSKSGNATAQPGDLVGTSAVVRPGARGVTIVIDRELP